MFWEQRVRIERGDVVGETQWFEATGPMEAARLAFVNTAKRNVWAPISALIGCRPGDQKATCRARSAHEHRLPRPTDTYTSKYTQLTQSSHEDRRTGHGRYPLTVVRMGRAGPLAAFCPSLRLPRPSCPLLRFQPHWCTRLAPDLTATEFFDDQTYDGLPSLREHLFTGNFDWLTPRAAGPDAYYTEPAPVSLPTLYTVEHRLAGSCLALPTSFVNFMRSAEHQRRIPSSKLRRMAAIASGTQPDEETWLPTALHAPPPRMLPLLLLPRCGRLLSGPRQRHPVTPEDQDPVANRRANSTAQSQNDFIAHWRDKILGDDTVHAQTVCVDGEVAGYVVAWWKDNRRCVGYWLGGNFWGRGVGTQALYQFLVRESTRPLFADTDISNVASQRLLERCGLRLVEDHSTASVHYLVFKLE